MKDFNIAKYLKEHQLGSYSILNHYVDLKPLKEEGKGIRREGVDKYGDQGESNLIIHVKNSKENKERIKTYLSKLKGAGITPSIETRDGYIHFYAANQEEKNKAKQALGMPISEKTDIPYQGHDHLDGRGGKFKQAEPVSEAGMPENIYDYIEDRVNQQDLKNFSVSAEEIFSDLIGDKFDAFEPEDIQKFLNSKISDVYRTYKMKQPYKSRLGNLEEPIDLGDYVDEDFDPTNPEKAYRKFIGRKPASIQTQSAVDKVMQSLEKKPLSTQDQSPVDKVMQALKSAAGISSEDIKAFIVAVQADPMPLEENEVSEGDMDAGKFEELKDLLSRYDFYYERRHGKKAPGHYEIITSIQDLMNSGVSEDEIKKAAIDSIKQAKNREVSEDELRHIGYFIDNAKNLTPDSIQQLKNLF